MEKVIELNNVLALANKLFLVDKVRLIGKIALQIEQAVQDAQKISRESLWGVLSDLGSAPTSEDIDQVHQDV